MGLTAAVNHLQLDIPARHQWEGNYGYCGEVSLISAGLYYGQYVSQYDARALASRGMDQTEEASQLLLGMNDEYAAAQLQLCHQGWDPAAGKSTQDFLAWIKKMIARGYPVALGVYMNERLFQGTADPNAGDADYDHIVPVIGVGSNHALSDRGYFADDWLAFSDNGLWEPAGASRPYVFEYAFGSLAASRRDANGGSAVYSLNNSCNYGIAITGVADAAGDTLPVRVSTDLNAEPPIADGSFARPPAVPLHLTVTVSGLQPGVAYRLYRYDSFLAVPAARFNAAAAQATRTWEIRISSGTTWVLHETIQSSDIAVYRAVRASTP